MERVETVNLEYVDKLVDSLGLAGRSVDCSWDLVEAVIGCPIPTDYKEFIGRTGSAVIDDRLCVFGPNPSEGVDITHMIESLDQGWEHLRQNEIELPERFFTGGRLVNFAAVDENYFFWDARDGVFPDDWGVVIVDADLEGWHEFDVSATECIFKVMVREIDVKPIGRHFGRAEHRIELFGT